MEKVINYIKSNKLYLSIMIIGLLALMLQMNYVINYADDFGFIVKVRDTGISGAIKEYCRYYMSWGGGVNVLIIAITLVFNISVWKVINSIIIAIIIALTVRMITYRNESNKSIVAIIMWISIFSLSIGVSREVIYWVCGSFSYMLPIFLMYVYFYYMFSKVIMKKEIRKFDYILLPISAVLAGWGSPQTGAIAFGTTLLLVVWAKFINKEKIKPIYIISILFSLIGFLVLYLAPGNYVRMEYFTEFNSLNFFDKILYRADSIFDILFGFTSEFEVGRVSFYLFILIGIIIPIVFNVLKTEKNKIIDIIMKICVFILILFILLNVAMKLNIFNILDEGGFEYKNLYTAYKVDGNVNGITQNIEILKYYAISIFAILAIVILGLYVGIKNKQVFPILMIISGFISQILMFAAPASELRTTYSAIIFFVIAIAYLIKMAYEDDVNVSAGIIAGLVIFNFEFAILTTVACLIFRSFKEKDALKTDLIAIMIVMIMVSVNQYVMVVKRYKENKAVYTENVRRIEEFKNSEENSKEIYLLKPTYEQYGFTPIVGIEWIEKDVRDYFELEEDVKLIVDSVNN